MIIKKSRSFTVGMLCMLVVGLCLSVVGCDKPKPPPINKGDDSDTALQKYYYAYEEKIYLDVVPDQFVIAYDKLYFSQIQRNLEENAQIKDIEFNVYGNYCVFTMENAKIKTLRASLGKQEGVLSINPLYTRNGGCKMIITDEVVVKFKDEVSQQEIDKIQQKYRLGIINITPFSRVFSVPIDLDPLDIANAIQISGLVIYSHPNFFDEGLRLDSKFNFIINLQN